MVMAADPWTRNSFRRMIFYLGVCGGGVVRKGEVEKSVVSFARIEKLVIYRTGRRANGARGVPLLYERYMYSVRGFCNWIYISCHIQFWTVDFGRVGYVWGDSSVRTKHIL